ncbi:hypothetical protein [Rhodoferax sp.]|uniref:hypothetical protein n=1 Tax=Rhodoferax sp. TaxID=50421 RepID=UPI0019DB7BDE|nr:hypothetical protein [Rhodoferax sp.]MBE0474942.1 hypothetical protein [Rhodoferax sp.]
MNNTFQILMRQATELTQAGSLNEATAVIQRTLRDAGDSAPDGENAESSPLVLEDCVFEVDAPAPA